MFSKFKKKQTVRKKRVIKYRIVYPQENQVESESRKEKAKVDDEDVEGAIKLLLEAGKKLYCPFCRARIAEDIEHLLRYHYRTLLLEEGVDPKEVDNVLEKRYGDLIRKRMKEVADELMVNENDIKDVLKDRAIKLLDLV